MTSRVARLSPEKLSEINQKCVCTICTCGRHRCPKKPVKFQGETSYHDHYVPHQITQCRRQPCKHHYQERHYDPDLIKTSYNETYTPHKINPDNSQKKHFEYRPRTGQFYGSTQYADNYIPKQTQIDGAKKCQSRYHYAPNRGKFQGTSTYNAQFTPKRGQTSKPGERPRYQRRNVPFQGQTTYHADYVPKKVQGDSPYKCNRDPYPVRKTKFQGQSAYNQYYKAHQIPKDNHCPILDLPQRPRQCSPGKSHLNYIARNNHWE